MKKQPAIGYAAAAITLATVTFGFLAADRTEHQKPAPQEETTSLISCATEEETSRAIPEVVEVVEIPVKEVSEAPALEVMVFDVPLEDELQLHILNECEKYGIDPAIITAMAFKESRYQANAIGDGGNSLGLLQIQPRWNAERMERLGCTDLLDPYQNVTVSVDILAEFIEAYGGNVEMAIIAYNMGMSGAKKNCFDKGVYSSQYSAAVMEKAEELRAGAFGTVIEE